MLIQRESEPAVLTQKGVKMFNCSYINRLNSRHLTCILPIAIMGNGSFYTVGQKEMMATILGFHDRGRVFIDL